jgi:uncharacterized OsmC-like protein
MHPSELLLLCFGLVVCSAISAALIAAAMSYPADGIGLPSVPCDTDTDEGE